jgi:hypothetical protein
MLVPARFIAAAKMSTTRPIDRPSFTSENGGSRLLWAIRISATAFDQRGDLDFAID